MKRFHFITLFIATCIFLQAGAQENKVEYLIKYDLASILGDQVTNSSGIQLGTELMLDPKQSLAFDVMYIFPCESCKQPYTTITSRDTRGWMISSEYRFYLVRGKHKASGFHLGPQILFQHTKSEMRETYNEGIENIYTVSRDLLATHAMAGYQFRLGGPFFFNPAFGLGLRLISSRTENKQGTDSGQHEFPYDKDFESGSKWFPGFTFNLKFCLKL